jgi:hypothetical protein
MKKYIFTAVLVVLFWAVAFYVLWQFNFRTGPQLHISIRSAKDTALRLYYSSAEQAASFDKKHSVEAEARGSDVFQLIRLDLPVDKTPRRILLSMGGRAGEVKIKYIALKGFLASRKWLPGDIVRDFSAEGGHFIPGSHGRHLTVEAGDGGPALSYKGDFSVQYRELLAGSKPWVLAALWSTVLSALFLLTLRFTSFFHVRVRGGSAFDIGLSAVFILLLVLPTARSQLYHKKNRSIIQNIEKRAAAPMPEFRLMKIFDFPSEFDLYYNDNFSYRRTLIRWYNRMKVRWLKVSPMRDKLMLGKDGWIFWTGDRVLRDYDGSWQYTGEELERIKDTLVQRRDWLEKKGAAFYLIVAPNKHTIYPEYLPYNIKKFSRKSRLDNLLEYLRLNTDIKIIDVREALLREKAAERLYYKLDTHWNHYGAFIAYRELISEVARDFPRVRPLSITDFNIKKQPRKTGELGVMLALGSELEEENIILEPRGGYAALEAPYLYDEAGSPYASYGVTKETNQDGLPGLVMFRDSFSSALVPFLSENFRRSVYLWTHNFSSALEVIEREKPEVVIHELVERFQHYLLHENLPPVKEAEASPGGEALPFAGK